MSRELRWTEHATEQLATIAEYISISSPVYAEQLVERIGSRLEPVRSFPESGRVVPEAQAGESLRELIEPPYRLIYSLQANSIDIVAIVHGRQDFASAVHAGASRGAS